MVTDVDGLGRQLKEGELSRDDLLPRRLSPGLEDAAGPTAKLFRPDKPVFPRAGRSAALKKTILDLSI